jgi:hypothetical protein
MGQPGPDQDGRVDLATAQRIVQAAAEQAALREDRARHIVTDKVASATRRGALLIALLKLGVLVAFAAVIAAAFYVYRSKRAAEGLAAEAGLGNGPAAQASGTIPALVVSGRQIYEENRAALYVIGYLIENKIGGCCTAFAIEPNVLATNAHCVYACRERGGTPVVIQNDAGGKVRFKILGMSPHPAYKQKTHSVDSPDVGLLRVEGRMPKIVTLASDAELRSIGPGDDAFVLGFPGRVMDPLSPSATFLSGRVGRVMGFLEEATTADKSVLIQHDAVTRGGNSGSPIFNQYGHVMGIHAAHIDEEEDVTISGEKTKRVNASAFRIGMRIDLLRGVPPP